MAHPNSGGADERQARHGTPVARVRRQASNFDPLEPELPAVRSLARHDHPRGSDADLLRDVVNVERTCSTKRTRRGPRAGDGQGVPGDQKHIAGCTHGSPRSVHLEDALVGVAERSPTTARYLADSN